MMNHPIHHTLSQLEAFFENVMAEIEDKVGRVEQYAKSQKGQYQIEQVQFIATFATAIFLAFVSSPFTVAIATGVGVAVKAFSPEQLENVQDTVFRILDLLPFGVKGLTGVVVVTYVPIVIPVTAGLCAGFKLGANI